MPDQRRFTMRKLVSLILAPLAAVAATSAPSTALAAGMYQVTDLGIATPGELPLVFGPNGQISANFTGGAIRPSDGSYSFQIAQSQTVFGNPYQTTVFQNGSVIATLNTLVGPPNYQEIFGSAINQSGMVAGTENASVGLGTAFYFTPASGMHAVPEPYPMSNALSSANSVNDAGLIVGTATGPHGQSNSSPNIAFLSSGQTSWDLNTLIKPGSGLFLTTAWDINDLGQITASAIDSKGEVHNVLLTPIPSPEPSALMLLAAVGLAFKGRSVVRMLNMKFKHTTPEN